MKNKVVLLIIAFYTAITVNSQNIKVGLSINSINDFDWNKPLGDFLNTEKFFSLRSNMPMKFGVCIQKDYKIFSPSLQVNLIYRKIKYFENHTPITNFNHYSLNIPLNLNYRKQLSDASSFIANIGVGINYILTSSDKTKTGSFSNGNLVYSFQIVKPDKPNAIINFGIGWECSVKNIGVFQFNFEYTFELSKQIKYMYLDKNFLKLTNNYRKSYLTYGLTYLLPLNNL